MTTGAPDPWERQPGESSRAYEAFLVYRDMGPRRSQRAVAEKVAKSRQLIGRWNAENKWVERVRQFEIHEDRILAEERKERRREIGRRHDKLADAFLAKVAQRLKNMSDEDLSKTSLWAAAQVFKIAAELQNTALELDKGDMDGGANDDWGDVVDRAFEYDAARENTLT